MDNLQPAKGNGHEGFAPRLKQARLAMGLTQSDMAFALGIKQTRYAKYEAGRSEAPYEILVRITRLTGLSLDYLIAGNAKTLSSADDALERLLQELLDVIPIPAVIYDEQSRLVGHNKAYQDTFFSEHPSVIRPGTPQETVLRSWSYSKGYSDSETEEFLRQRLSPERGRSTVQEIHLGSQSVRFAESYYGPYCLVLITDVQDAE